MKSSVKSNRGFTLVELLLYVAIFAVTAGIITSVMVNAIKIQGNESGSTEVNNQLNYVLTTTQRLVQQSSEIEYAYPTGSPTTTTVCSTGYCTLELRIQGQGAANDYLYDPTFIISSSTPNGVYLQRGATGTPVLLTNGQIVVNNMQFTIYTIPGGNSTVQVNASFSYNTANPQLSVTKTLESAIGRVSAATFDSNILPSSDNSLSIGLGGGSPVRWSNLFLSNILGLGTSTANPSAFSAGNMYYNTASNTVMVSTNGSSWTSVSPFVLNGTSTYYMGGNVGIGTTTPITPLYVAGVGTFAGGAGNELPGGGGRIQIVGGYTSPVSGRMIIGDGSGWKMDFSNKTSGGIVNDLVTIQDNGNVGIGTAVPATGLQVAGSSTVRIGVPSTVWTGCVEMYDSVNTAQIEYIYTANGVLMATTTHPTWCQ